MEQIRITKKGSLLKSITIILVIAVVFMSAVNLVNLDFQKFFDRLSNVPDVLKRMMAIDFSIVPEAILSIITSLSLAFLTLVIAVILSTFLSFLAASNIAPSKSLSLTIKGVLAIIRAVPSLVWGLMVIASIGFGYTSGFVAMMFPALGFLIKTFTGSIEDAGDEIIEAMKSTGASWLNIIFHGLIPLCITSFVSWITIRFESNVSSSIELGIIGVGGIGLLLTQSINSYNYAQTTTLVIMICILMICIELVVTKVKNSIKYGSN